MVSKGKSKRTSHSVAFQRKKNSETFFSIEKNSPSVATNAFFPWEKIWASVASEAFFP